MTASVFRTYPYGHYLYHVRVRVRMLIIYFGVRDNLISMSRVR